MKTAMINIENLKKQRENIFFSSHTILFILNIDLDDIPTSSIPKENSTNTKGVLFVNK